MTLGISIICKDGIVLASDSQGTIGHKLKRYNETKIHTINVKTELIAAGDSPHIQRVLELIDNMIKRGEIRPNDIARKIKEKVVWAAHTATSEFRDRYKKALENFWEAPTSHLILVSSEPDNQIYLIDHLGNCQKINNSDCIGSGKEYAEAILIDQYESDVSLIEGREIAYWVLKKCQRLDPNIGPPFIIKISNLDGGFTQVKDNEMDHLEEVYKIREESFTELRKKFSNIPEMLRYLESSKNKSKK